ncbi:GNAT family N-acetyltransferase [Vibrio splendidus]|uniref:GNAT family N-acetyltransferase n=1 Tax=Vibrio splendidus TaxID=29497 RepID=UPI000CB2A1F7|nr:GNAT family N-acetyltransferase [Vibrio splendidus]PMH69525.1 GNAT family N-acetyltransferase [Vibrio splendidus]PMJ23888.1 GNAT family N-acetyltransferase [Vibrio splendidus]
MTLRTADAHELDYIYLMGFDVWGGSASVDEYLACCNKNDKYQKGTWYVLIEHQKILSSLIVYQGVFGLVDGSCGLGSVATPPELRGKGYASKLINMIKNELLQNQNNTVLFLHSDIDKEFYRRLGFTAIEGSDCMYSTSDNAEFKGAIPAYF